MNESQRRMNLPESGIQMDGDDISVRISIPRSSPLKYFKPDNVTHQAVNHSCGVCVSLVNQQRVCLVRVWSWAISTSLDSTLRQRCLCPLRLKMFSLDEKHWQKALSYLMIVWFQIEQKRYTVVFSKPYGHLPVKKHISETNILHPETCTQWRKGVLLFFFKSLSTTIWTWTCTAVTGHEENDYY